MRRTDREVPHIDDIIHIINQCKIMRIAMLDENIPYIVPVNFGYLFTEKKQELYFHSALQGRKVHILQHNASVCIEMDCGHELLEGDTACQYSYLYESVIGEGSATLITSIVEKKKALMHIMSHQTNKEFHVEDKALSCINVYKICLSSLTGKAHRHK